ncbi:hypothetical protein TNIN_275121 [Trichonephila inaurata madagascariensis]|uniref:Uncharacterized protein n=1 Tax=Trichonephila inaurata madagascariensis TaxID=2747483 RepID=A0A8X6ISN3_9ARAC|nr:hypothetical protein TNIN_275121 [Trichonephila inaurata madagascariensis]
MGYYWLQVFLNVPLTNHIIYSEHQSGFASYSITPNTMTPDLRLVALHSEPWILALNMLPPQKDSIVAPPSQKRGSSMSTR